MSDYCLYPNQCGVGMDCSPCYQNRIAELESKLAAAEADAGRWLKVSEHEPPYGEHILIAFQLAGGDWFICYGFVQSDWSLRSVDDDDIGYDLDDDAYWMRVKLPIDAARGAK